MLCQTPAGDGCDAYSCARALPLSRGVRVSASPISAGWRSVVELRPMSGLRAKDRPHPPPAHLQWGRHVLSVSKGGTGRKGYAGGPLTPGPFPHRDGGRGAVVRRSCLRKRPGRRHSHSSVLRPPVVVSEPGVRPPRKTSVKRPADYRAHRPSRVAGAALRCHDGGNPLRRPRGVEASFTDFTN